MREHFFVGMLNCFQKALGPAFLSVEFQRITTLLFSAFSLYIENAALQDLVSPGILLDLMIF